jgi:hypothetical protein
MIPIRGLRIQVESKSERAPACLCRPNSRPVRIRAGYSEGITLDQFLYGWQPIETAPKDHTRVLVFDKGWHIAKWLGAEGCRDDGTRIGNPTHWMRLPGDPRHAFKGMLYLF